MIQAVIFDWAGTTIDYGCMAPIAGFMAAFEAIGVPITMQQARAPMGMLKIDHTRAIAASVKERAISEEEIQKAYAVFEEKLFASLQNHCGVIPHVLDTVRALRAAGLKIGSTTGYTSAMMELVLAQAEQNGYRPDFCIASDKVPRGRPAPYMIWKNLEEFGIENPRHAVKVGDTVADICEGVNAGCWSVGVLLGSSEMGLTQAEAAALPSAELAALKETARQRFYAAGADYIIEDIRALPSVIEEINQRLAQNAPRKLMTPGPLTTKAAVKQAMLTDHCTWDQEYKTITSELMAEITAISANKDYATVLLQGSGSYAVEAMLTGFCGPEDKFLLLTNGEYGNRMAQTMQKAGKAYVQLASDMCQPLCVSAAKAALEEDSAITGVVFVHCETTTGVLNPLAELCQLAKSQGKKVLVDAMSSFAAYDIDMPGLGIDALAASANKCLEGLPGLGFVIAKKALLEESRGNACSHSLDLYAQYKELYQGGGKFRFTSPTNILLALCEAVRQFHQEGGLPARQARYRENHRILVEGLACLGIQPIVPPQHQSHIITTFHLGKLDFTRLYEHLKQQGFVIYPGKLTDIPTFRLGNIGDIYPGDMERLVEIFAAYLAA